MHPLPHLRSHSKISQLRLRCLYTKWLLALRFKNFILRGDDWIFSRTACLSNDSFSLLAEDAKLYRFNLQKVRSDFLLSQLERKSGALIASTFIQREDIVPLIWMQFHVNIQNMPKPKYILFDSFSDLTDIQFMDSQTGTHFFCHKSDLVHLYNDNTQLLNLGLLSLEDIASLYENLFQKFQELWGGELISFLFTIPSNSKHALI